MTVFWRSWIIVCLLVATVLAILGALTTVQYEATLSHLIRGRLAVLAQTARGSFDAALSLGLPLSGMRNAQAILERTRQTDPKILAVHVFDGAGRILHSTDPSHPTSVQPELVRLSSASEGDLLYVETDQHLLSGALFSGAASTSTSTSPGGLVIVYPRSELSTPVRAMAARLAVHGVVVLVSIGLVAGMVLRLGLRELIRVFGGIELAFSALERREWRRMADGSDPLPAPVRGLGIDTGELMRMVQEADAQYVVAGKELARLEAGGETSLGLRVEQGR